MAALPDSRDVAQRQQKVLVVHGSKCCEESVYSEEPSSKQNPARDADKNQELSHMQIVSKLTLRFSEDGQSYGRKEEDGQLHEVALGGEKGEKDVHPREKADCRH